MDSGRAQRGEEVPDRDQEGLDKVPRGEGVPGQDREGLDRLDGLTREGWGAPHHRAMLAGVQVVGMEVVAVDMEGIGGRETGRLK